jgi:hypothetical protein
MSVADEDEDIALRLKYNASMAAFFNAVGRFVETHFIENDLNTGAGASRKLERVISELLPMADSIVSQDHLKAAHNLIIETAAAYQAKAEKLMKMRVNSRSPLSPKDDDDDAPGPKAPKAKKRRQKPPPTGGQPA